MVLKAGGSIPQRRRAPWWMAAVGDLVSGVLQATNFAQQFCSYLESEKQWKAPMEFVLHHLSDYCDPPDGHGHPDPMLSLSRVWANHLFLGCSYNKDLLDKVMEMADGVEVEDLPQFTTSSELMKKHQSQDGRFMTFSLSATG
ncbi:CDKN2AIP N-terminal-like protein [Eptesicus fuscus]|uniref:CDKN2AIP N-terminal-like protein n=1 Tax=Eptesicus fuscus TaxID=29078 RepID=UPI002403AB5A|nr:CDKN2AIP N-terminal-like protein [Eptesicus fuscus]